MASKPHDNSKHKAMAIEPDDDDVVGQQSAEAPVTKPAPPAPTQQHATLAPDDAVSLFYNGHRIAKQGDPQVKWMSMARTGDGTAVIQMPMTEEMADVIRAGEYYLVDDQG